MEKQKNVKKSTSTSQKKKTTNKKVVKKKKGFTLIELLAVIIILGILMIIAIPSVTRYISDSRKAAYADTAKQIIGAARNLVNSGELEMYSTETTYYIDQACLKTENDASSPYGEFVEDGAYVVVTYDGKGYNYYWTSVDDAGQGVKNITRVDKLDSDSIESDLNKSDISNSLGIDGRSRYMVINETTNCKSTADMPVSGNINGETGEKIVNAVQTIESNEELLELADAKRYVGENPNNYISFNNELWRIIGIYGNNLKIIKATNPLKDVRYNDSESSTTWESSLIKSYLNETYYNSIDADYRNMIINGTWYVGKDTYYNTASQVYETDKQEVWTGKVGLLATYEFMFAARINNDCWHNTSTNDNCSSKNWLYFNKDTNINVWLMNADSGFHYLPRILQSYYEHKGINRYTEVRFNVADTYPVVYLKSTVRITGGTGTYNNPYVLDIE